MFFEKNINAMTENMSFIKNRIEKRDYDLDDVEYGTEDVAGRKILFAVKEGTLMQLDTLYNQDVLLNKWFENTSLKYNSKVFMFGIGNGMFLRKLHENSDAEVRFYIYEPSFNSLITILHEFDLSDMLSSERVNLFIPEKENATNRFYHALSKVLTYPDITGYVNFVYPNYNAIYEDEYMEYHKSLQELFDALQANRLVYEKFGKSYFTNSFVNFPYFCFGKNMNTLWPYLSKDMPAIIVSSGPSLSKNIEELKRAKGKALIIAADSAVNVLLNHEIIPDLFVCIDSNKNKGHFINPLIKDIPMICMISTAQIALKEHAAPCYFVNDSNPHILWFMQENDVEYPALSCGGSVANTATSFAEVMGLSNIILVGQDLAYTNGRTHATGSLRASWNLDYHDESFIYIEGQNGELVESSNQFKVYRDWFEREIIDHPDLNLINATEGGAKIHGAIQTTLKEAIDTYCTKEYDIASIFSNSGYLFDEEIREQMMDYMFSTADELKTIKNDIRQCISIYEKMEILIHEGKYHSNKFIKYYKNSEEIFNKLMDNQAVYYPECMMQREIGETLRTTNDIENEEQKELLAAIASGKEYIALIGEKIDELLPEMRGYIEDAEKLCNEINKNRIVKYTSMKLQHLWDKILNRINPNMSRSSLEDIRNNLSEVTTYSDDSEYDLFVNNLYNVARSLRPEMTYISILIYAFIVGDNCKDFNVLKGEIRNILSNDDTMSDEQKDYLAKNIGDIDTCSEEKIYEKLFVKYTAFLDGEI